MDPNHIRTNLTDYESRMPFADEIQGVYDFLGRVAIKDNLEFDYSEDVLAEKLISPNSAYDEGGVLYEEVTKVLAENDDTASEDILDAGLKIAEYIKNNNKTVRAQFTGYLQAAFQIDRLKIGLRGTDGSLVASNSILFFARKSLIEGMDASERNLASINNVDAVLSDIYAKEEWFGWFIPKSLGFREEFLSRLNAKKVLGAFQPTSPDSLTTYINTEGTTPQEDVGKFVNKTMRERKYGVKPAFTEASIGGSWVYYDAEELYRFYNSDKFDATLVPPAAAIIFHSPKTEFNNLKLKTSDMRFGGNANIGYIGSELEPDVSLFLSMDGELYVDPAQFFSLRRELQETPGLYEAVLAEVIANFHDLTVSLGTVTAMRNPNFVGLTNEQKKRYDPILQLLAPRLKREYLEPELQEPTGRTVRAHGVTWFVRNLPVGFHASPESIERALEHGIVLSDNETFVRSHERGSQNPVQGHRINRRLPIA